MTIGEIKLLLCEPCLTKVEAKIRAWSQEDEEDEVNTAADFMNQLDYCDLCDRCREKIEALIPVMVDAGELR